MRSKFVIESMNDAQIHAIGRTHPNEPGRELVEIGLANKDRARLPQQVTAPAALPALVSLIFRRSLARE
jgi:hypothetical protein